MALRQIARLLAQVVPLLFILTLSTVVSPVAAVTNPMTLPTGFEDTMAYGGLLAPRAFTFTPDGRVLALERGSANSNDSNLASIRVFKNGTLLPTRAHTVNTCGDSERGLLGIAVDPNFATNGYIYIYYTRQATTGQACAFNTFTNGIATGPRNRVSRLTMSGDTVIPGSERVLIDSIITDIGYHNGGDLRFGTDGYLYISTGDGGQSWTSQNLGMLNGKLLRILPTPGEAGGYTTNNNPYNTASGSKHCVTIPPGTVSGICKEIYASGLRNPFRFTIQPAMGSIPGTGTPFVGDVGGGAWEEIDQIRSGGNYGYPEREGFCPGGVVCSPPYQSVSYDNPLAVYSHLNVNANYDSAIIGGDFYTGGAGWPATYNNNYFYTDVVRGFIRRLSYNTTSATWESVAGDFGTNGSSVIGLKRGPDGNLYYLTFTSEIDRVDGIRRIRYTSSQNQAPVAVLTSDKQSGSLGTQYTLSGESSYDPDGNNPLTYLWDFGDGTTATTSTPTTTKTYSTAGNKTVKLTVRDNGSPVASSTPATLIIYAGNQAPTGEIALTNITDNSRTASSTFYAGDVWSYAVANAGDDEALPAGAFMWEIVFHHSTHTHPFLPYLEGSSGQFTIPNTGELDPIVWYRVYLYITDSRGQRTTVVKDVNPITTNLTFDTNPPGGQVTIEGAIFNAPRTITRVVGMRFSINAPSPQQIGSASYTFGNWAQGGSQLQTITVPSGSMTYTANLNVFVPTATPIPATSLWTNTATPSSAYNGTAPLELGVKFQTSVNARVTGIRFYKGSGNTGTHIGRLWSSSGALIASATFTNETVSGWQTVTFPSPVNINANTIYIASYNSPTGKFSYNANYFSTARTNGILTAPSSSSVGGNGVFANGSSGTFPNMSGHNYWVDVQVVAGGAGATPMPSPTATPIPPASLWTTSTVPAVTEYNGTGPIELGVKFQTSVNALVTGIRFWKGATNTGTHVGRLWASNGTPIATFTFTNETASGWQTVMFPSPVAISANTLYVVSYNSPTGKFSYTANYFSGARTNGILTAPSSGSVGGNGVFMPGPSGTFPSSAGHNYWVDVLVMAGGAGATPMPTLTPIPTATKTPTPILTSTPVGMNTLWTTAATPAVADVVGTSPIELGVKFRTNVNALVTGIRFYKGTSNTGTHTGHLWTSNGTLLGTAVFTNETASGWQTVTFPTPIAINANTTYVASYFSPTGRFSYTGNYFANAVVSGILTAPDNASSGGNGVFTRGANGSFPVTASGANNFWVDVMVMPNGSGNAPTLTPLPSNTPTATPLPAASPTPVSGGGSTSVTVSIDSGINDVNEVSGALDATSSSLWIGSAGTTSSYTGLRFSSVNIPKTATITSAQLQFYSVNQQWIAINLTIAGEANGNSAAFAANALPSQRALTTARIPHASDEGWSANTWYTLADVKTIVQEMINLGSWQSGSPITLILQGDGGWGRKYVRAVEGGSTGSVRLVITYTN